MTSVSPTSAEELSAAIDDAPTPGQGGRLDWLWAKLEKLADRANPILVKETRQALKSRQFVVTFLVVLIACWVASFAVVMIVGPDAAFFAAGSEMLMVYAVILAFPLMLIVPYTAFRSLASEQEDNTYDLLSITTLNPGEIITGKLCSAIVQMLVYLCAVSPCIAFTFLLRGVDALTVAILLGYLVLTSLGLSLLSLLAGTMAKVRYSQVLVSVLLVVVLAGNFFTSIPMIAGFVSESYSFIRDDQFFYANMAFLTSYATSFLLLHRAAAAQIAFKSENRSTPLRQAMLLQYACFLGWMSVPVMLEGSTQFVTPVLFMSALAAGIYWYFMGTLLTSEWPHLSRRVQRSLPQSQLGRTFLTWLNPGPGTGYMFSVANLTVLVVAGLIMLATDFGLARGFVNEEQIFFFYTIGWSYFVFFLGLGKLLISFVRRFAFVSLTAGFLLHTILLLVACGGPMIIAFMTSSLRFGNDYSLLHITNPIWTLIELLDSGPATIDAWAVLIVVGSAAIIVFLLNLRAVAVEVRHHRVSLPTRVAEDEAELHPAPEELPSNPWEAEDQS